MTPIVLDANVAIDWHLQTEVGDAYSSPLLKLAKSGNVRFMVPEHFTYEVARILVIRGLHGVKDVAPMGAQWMHAALSELHKGPIDTYVVGLNFELLGKLAETFDLSAPDVPYFHMARETGTAIATRDKAIIRACEAWNVHHWTPPTT